MSKGFAVAMALGLVGLGCTAHNASESWREERQSTTTTQAQPINLDLDVPLRDVSGTVTLNGAKPQGSCTPDIRGHVRFENPETGDSFQIPIQCRLLNPFAFSGKVPRGTYRISVEGSGTGPLPVDRNMVHSSFTIADDVRGLSVDVQTRKVAGRVTLNGAQPQGTCTSGKRAEVWFVGVENEYQYKIPIPCTASEAPFAFSGSLAPGAYRVLVYGLLIPDTDFKLPQQLYMVNPSLSVTQDVSDLVLDVPTRLFTGTVTLNGEPLVSRCPDPVHNDQGSVELWEAYPGYGRYSISIPCTTTPGPATFRARIPPGTYSVFVTPSDTSAIPHYSYTRYGMFPSFTVTDDVTALNLDVKARRVSGTVTLNGASPPSTCTMEDRAQVSFTSERGDAFYFPVPCGAESGAPYHFEATVPPGVYQVTVEGTSYSSWPASPVPVSGAVTVTEDTTALALDAKRWSLAGVVTLDGAPPQGDDCTPGKALPYLWLRRRDDSPSLGLDRTFSFKAQVNPGEYHVTVMHDSPSCSNIPAGQFAVRPSLVVNGDQSGLVFDVKTRSVSGALTVRGHEPTDTCRYGARARVTFLGSDGSAFYFNVPCDPDGGPFVFSGKVSPGTYRVILHGSGTDVDGAWDLPGSYEIYSRLQID